MNFESNIKDPTAPIAIDFDPGRHVLILAFGGLAGQLAFPMFEFNKLTSGLKNVNKIYLRDVYKLWYHHGLPDIGDNIDGIATFLRQYTTHPSTQRSIIFGNSGGGYAALLFGHILKVDEVHAFSPKTFIDPIKRFILGDIPPMPGNQIRAFWWLLYHGQRKYFDVRKVLQASPKSSRNFHIYYSASHKIDSIHATRIESIPGVCTHSYPFGQHSLIRDLKQSGEMSQIIEQAIQLGD